jgi:hypothetical protein
MANDPKPTASFAISNFELQTLGAAVRSALFFVCVELRAAMAFGVVTSRLPQVGPS